MTELNKLTNIMQVFRTVPSTLDTCYSYESPLAWWADWSCKGVLSFHWLHGLEVGRQKARPQFSAQMQRWLYRSGRGLENITLLDATAFHLIANHPASFPQTQMLPFSQTLTSTPKVLSGKQFTFFTVYFSGLR